MCAGQKMMLASPAKEKKVLQLRHKAFCRKRIAPRGKLKRCSGWSLCSSVKGRYKYVYKNEFY
jgi:hypothetical protein